MAYQVLDSDALASCLSPYVDWNRLSKLSFDHSCSNHWAWMHNSAFVKTL